MFPTPANSTFEPYNHIIYPGVAKIYLVFFWKCLEVVSADITIFGKLFHTFTILDAKENFLKSYILILSIAEKFPKTGGRPK